MGQRRVRLSTRLICEMLKVTPDSEVAGCRAQSVFTHSYNELNKVLRCRNRANVFHPAPGNTSRS